MNPDLPGDGLIVVSVLYLSSAKQRLEVLSLCGNYEDCQK